MFRTLQVLILLTVCVVGSAAEPTKWNVYVDQSGDDSVGQRLAFAVKEAIRTSAGYALTDEKGSAFQIVVVSLDTDAEKKGFASAVAVVYTTTNFSVYKPGIIPSLFPITLNSGVRVVGSNRVAETAMAILAGLDKLVGDYGAVGVLVPSK